MQRPLDHVFVGLAACKVYAFILAESLLLVSEEASLTHLQTGLCLVNAPVYFSPTLHAKFIYNNSY